MRGGAALLCAALPHLALAQDRSQPAGATAAPPEQPSDSGRNATSSGAIPPQLKQFVPAPYPPEAERQRLEGNVVLQLDLDAQGKVTGVTVVNPAGHGFDEAASEAARQFVFAPAMRNGRPIPSRILYRYAFTLQDDTQEEPPSDQPAAPIQSLSGSVRSAAGDVPLAGATVTVTTSGGERQETVTNEDGTWAFSDLAAGNYAVRIEAPGYSALEVQEQVEAGQATEVVYRLAAEGTMEIVIRGKRPAREVTKRTLERREIEKIPGTSGDALRSIQNLPGVARPPSIAGILVVRGSAPEDTEVFFDGISIPIVYHFGGLSSVVPTEMLDRIDFYPGNFSAQYGRVMGGIVDVGLRTPKDDGRYHGLAQIDLIDFRAMLEGPVPLVKGWTFALAARRSWFDTWLKPVLDGAGADVTAAPVYYDYQAYVETKPSPRSRFRAGIIGSNDRLELLTRDAAEDEPTISGNLRTKLSFYRLFAAYENDFSDDLSFRTVFGWGSDVFDFSVGGLFFKMDNKPLVNRSELTYKMGKGATIHGGIDMLWGPATAEVRAPAPPRAGEPDPGPLSSRKLYTLFVEDDIYRPAAYVELQLTPYRRVKLVPGLRVDYAKDTESWDISPRFNARYTLIEGYPQTTLKGGIGLFQRPPDFQESYPPFGTPGLQSNRAIHYSLGAEQDLSRQVDVSVEGFYKDLDQLVSRVPSDAGNYEYNNVGRGRVVGAEVLLRYKPGERFFGWLAYTISRSERQNSPEDEVRLDTFDQTHILTALGSYRLGRGWDFGARYRLVSGNPTTPIIGGIYNANGGVYAAIEGEPLSERLPLFHQLDLRVDKTWDYRVWKLSTYLDVQNVYYSQNVEGYAYNYNFTRKTPVTGLPIIPSLGLRAEF